jgi:4-hydroxybenzoate polyprenyltransferase
VAHAALLAVAMAAFQASIGAANDLADRDLDAAAKPWKPLPAGRVSAGAARRVAVASYAIGLGLSAVAGPAALVVGIAGHGLGLAYDLRLKRAGWGWPALALALPLVPVYAWVGVGAGLPPRLGPLVVLGVLAGLQLGLANELVDLDSDAAAHGRGLAVRLGRRPAALTMIGAAVGLACVAALTVPGASAGTVAALAVASAASVTGAASSSRSAARWRWLGWQTQAVGVVLLALAWLSAGRA